MATTKNTNKSAKSTTGKNDKGFSDFEKAAMKDRAKELKAEANKANLEKAVLAAIAEMPEPDRSIATRIHEIVKANAPGLTPKTWYGMPAYANKDGKVVCFFQPAAKFEARYATFGFTDLANIDDGAMFPVGYALKELTADGEKKFTALVRKAVS